MGRFISRERIGLAEAPEFHGAQLGQAFDVGAHACEIAEAGEEFDQVLRPARHVGLLEALRKGQAGDLGGARGDGHAQAMLVDDDGALDRPSAPWIVLELLENRIVHQVVRQLRHGVTCGFHTLADRVQREEVAQEDPEPFHAETLNRRMGRLIQNRYVLQILGRGV